MSLTRKLLRGQSSFMLRKPCCGICIFVTYYFDTERLKLWYHCENIISEAANRDKHTLHIEFSWILMTQIWTVLSFYVSLSDWNTTPCPNVIKLIVWNLNLYHLPLTIYCHVNFHINPQMCSSSPERAESWTKYLLFISNSGQCWVSLNNNWLHFEWFVYFQEHPWLL